MKTMMKTTLAMAVAVATTGLLTAAAPSLRGNAPSSPATPVPMQSDDGRDGRYKSDADHARDILWLLADVADRAAADSGWQRVSDWLSSKDRHRIVDGLKSINTKEYAEAAKSFRAAWKKKYGSEFNAHRQMSALEGTKITFRDEGGRKFGTVYFPAFGGEPPFEMRVQLEAKDKWRIEIPNDIDAQKFVDGLKAGLERVVNNPRGNLLDEEKIGLNAVITQIVSGLSFEPGKATSSKRK